VLVRDKRGLVVAYNTDASALGSELKEAVSLGGVDATGRPVALVLGNGGAAFAAVVGCRLAGSEEIVVTARSFTSDREEKHWPNAERLQRLGARTVAWWGSRDLAAIVGRVHLVVQATSAGMKGAGGGEELAALIPWQEMQRTVAYDLVYVPRTTPFLQAAEQAGHFARGGLGMLVGQARDAIEIWLGKAPPTRELASAAEEALAR
jgi:shikimate dehydrogenase